MALFSQCNIMLNHKCERKSTKQKDVFGNGKAKKAWPDYCSNTYKDKET